MLSATADTNIYVSGLNFRAPPRRFLDLAAAGRIRLDISDEIMAETLRVLRHKFQWSAEGLREAEDDIRSYTQRAMPMQALDVVRADPSDNRIVECAVATGSDFIVSGDKHLLQLGRYGNIRIVKVADFLELARRESREPKRR